ncbi:MAG: DNA primase [Pseudomonadales bacterium]
MAGLIPQRFIDDLLERVDIVEVIDQRVTLKKAGRSYKACCPFHNEKTPSFNVNADKQFYYCFGCGAGGNAIGFLMDYDNVDFPAAVEALAAQAGMEVPREKTSPQNAKLQKKSQSIFDVLAFANRFYQQQLRKHDTRKRAVDYLKNRGVSGEIARDFALGFVPEGWDNLLQAARKENFSTEQIKLLEDAGMLVKKDNGQYYDRFRNRIIFPIRDNRGRVIAFGGRVLDDDLPKYLNSPETEVFYKQRELYGLYEARKLNRSLDQLVLVEGYMDVIALFQFGISYALATLGTASNIAHLEKIFRHTNRLVVCFDGDAAGRKAAQRLLEIALPAMRDGREILFMYLPAGEDPDTFIKRKGKEAFLYEMEKAAPLEEELFAAASEGVALDSDAGIARFVNNALPLIAQLPTGVFRTRITRQLAERAAVPIDLLEQQLAEQRVASPASRETGQSGSPLNRSASTAGNSVSTDIAAASETAAGAFQRTIHNAQPGDREAKASAPGYAQSVNSSPLLVWALATLLHFPEFAEKISIDEEILDRDAPESALLRELYGFIRGVLDDEGAPPTTYRILGHWHGTDTGRELGRCAASHIAPLDADVALREFGETLAKLAEHQRAATERSRALALTKRNPSELSAAEKAFLQNLGKKSPDRA